MKQTGRLALIATSLIFTLTSCKTQEQIKREQMIDTLAIQMVEYQKLTANTSVRLQQIEERLGMVTGKIEESGHQSKQEIKASLKVTNDRLSVIEESNKTTREDITNLETKISEQDKFLKKILKSIGKIAGTKSSKPLSPYEQALRNYKKGRYKKANAQYLELLSSKKFKGTKRARIIHNLGMIAYIEKKNNDAMTYFGRLFTEHPKSGYNGSGLYHLSKTFQRLGQIDQAKETLTQLIERFPKHKRAKSAKKLLQSL